MKNLFISIAAVISLLSCKQETEKTSGAGTLDSTGKELWAEQVESSTSLVTPEGWTEEDWKMVAKGIDREKIFNTIIDVVLSGKKQAYDYITDRPLTLEEATGMIIKIDSAYVDEGDGNVKTSAVMTRITAKELSTVKCREKWYFDKENFKLYTQINSIAFFTNAYSEEGDLMGIRALFYVKLDK